MKKEEIRSARSDGIAIGLFAFGMVGVSWLLHLIAVRLEVMAAFLLPEDTPIPAIAKWTLNFPYLGFGAVFAVAAFAGLVWYGKWPWMRRHLPLLLSIGWTVLLVVGGTAAIGVRWIVQAISHMPEANA